MKEIREMAAIIVTNASIGITAIVAIVGVFVGGLYLLEMAEKLFVHLTPSSIQFALSIGISSITVLYLLTIFGLWVREKIEDIIWELRSQRQVSK